VNVPKPEVIKLTVEEQAIFDRIFETGHENDETASAAAALTGSLLNREAIPLIRIRYFADPELSIGSKWSIEQTFERNGTRGEAIWRHGNFLPYLKYFVLGPNLPDAVIHGFRTVLIEDRGTSGQMIDQLCQFARNSVRRFDLDRRDAAEEFYKLALECGLDRGWSRSVRDAALNTR
jgi:hypothetical protein